MCFLRKVMVVVIVAMALLAGCSSEGETGKEKQHSAHTKQQTDSSLPAAKLIPIQVDLTVPEPVKVNEEVTIIARVTQKEAAVDDAKVVFEWWLDGEEHQRYEGKWSEDGKYEFIHAFDKPGTYTVISHVDARDLHSMPKKEFKVKQ
ncbi:FixH family protein [Paenibacillus assamensis]|uniref:FixH family protein n=1 Tax=Paenibacillus assamensis TaxID=311244 RepID=UPI00048F3953|nr:FixH family protein [Paenibacillus assamensis]